MPSKPFYPYVAKAFDHVGHVTGRWEHATVQGAMTLADHHAHPVNRISVRAAFTSDDTFQGVGAGREMAYSTGKFEKGARRWQVESYRDRLTEQPPEEHRYTRGRDMTKAKRNVRWFEDRQDRASDRAARLSRLSQRLMDRAIDLRNEAYRMTKKKDAKKRAELEALAKRFEARAIRYSREIAPSRGASARYSRAKTKVGVYRAEGSSGWTDRDRSRRRRTTKRSTRRTTKGARP